MKKVLLVAAVAGLSMVSCKKDYTCECVTSITGSPSTTSSVTIKDTKKNAEEACNGKATSSVPGASASVVCSIK